MNQNPNNYQPISNENEFVQGFEGNPFARLFCRNLPNKMCSGTCGSCKKEREVFKAKKMKTLDSRNNNGDPDFENIYGTHDEVWASWIATIQREKLRFWERRSEARILAEEVVKQSTIIVLPQSSSSSLSSL